MCVFSILRAKNSTGTAAATRHWHSSQSGDRLKFQCDSVATQLSRQPPAASRQPSATPPLPPPTRSQRANPKSKIESVPRRETRKGKAKAKATKANCVIKTFSIARRSNNKWNLWQSKRAQKQHNYGGKRGEGGDREKALVERHGKTLAHCLAN